MENVMLLAIDPGAKGAIALRNSLGHVEVCKMPGTECELWNIIERVKFVSEDHGCELVALLEKVGFHVKGNNASASAKFATNVGLCRMALTAARISYQMETPNTWMKALPITLPKDKNLAVRKKKRKAAIREYVERRYPVLYDGRITNDTADALGMLAYMEDKYHAKP
jgi:hypothetical protein